MICKFEIPSHKFNRKVLVSEALDADANGIYVHAGVHCGLPAYRRASRSSVFWICHNTDGDWLVWRQKDDQSVRYIESGKGRSELGKSKLPTGHWYSARKEVLCKLEYVYGEKARLLNDGIDLI